MQCLELRVLVHHHGLVVVQPLLLQQLRQVALAAAGLLQLGSLVLEPDLDLVVVESELGGEGAAPLLRQVAVGVELVLEPVELVAGEGRPGSLVVLTRELLLLLLHLPGSGATGGSVRIPDN